MFLLDWWYSALASLGMCCEDALSVGYRGSLHGRTCARAGFSSMVHLRARGTEVRTGMSPTGEMRPHFC